MSSRQLILKNSILLFVRSIVVIVIGLYSSRVLLQKLGVEDFGVYSIVAGVVILFDSVRSMFTNAIQRFLNYNKKDKSKQNAVFNAGVLLQLILAGAFVFLTETLGLIAFLHLNLTESQFAAARVVYQLIIASTVLSILTAPYDALIIAHERMDVYAWFSILSSALRLAIIFLISLGPFSRLVNYAILLTAVSCFMRFLTMAYCRRHFEESRLRRSQNKSIMKEMSQFAGWNFLGFAGLNIMHQGANYIFNLTGGVIVNAARTIAYQVMGGASTLVGNVNTAFKPQTHAAAAGDDLQEFYRLLGYNAKAAFCSYLLIVVPVLVFARQLIGLWLGQVPEYVVTFLLAISPYYLLRSLHELVNQFFISIGEMKWYQIIDITTMVLNVPLAWILLHNGFPFWMVFLGMTVLEAANHFCSVWLGVRRYGFPLRYFIREVYLPFFIIAGLAALIVSVTYQWGYADFDHPGPILLGGIITEAVLLIAVFFIALTKRERTNITSIIRHLQ